MAGEPYSHKTMLPYVHDHIDRELQQVARTDTIFVIVAVLFNLVVLGINWGVATSSSNELSDSELLANNIIFYVLLISTVIITIISLRALSTSKSTRQTLMNGLTRLYEDEGVAQYYNASLIKNYSVRNTVFSTIIGILGGLAVIVPLIQKLIG